MKYEIDFRYEDCVRVMGWDTNGVMVHDERIYASEDILNTLVDFSKLCADDEYQKLLSILKSVNDGIGINKMTIEV